MRGLKEALEPCGSLALLVTKINRCGGQSVKKCRHKRGDLRYAGFMPLQRRGIRRCEKTLVGYFLSVKWFLINWIAKNPRADQPPTLTHAHQ
jgi:hypothetical protein